MKYSPQDWFDAGQFKTVLGQKIFTVEAGESDKPTILFIHGFPTSSWDWTPIWDDFKQDYHLITLDLLGFGYSDKPKGHDYSILEQADIVEALIAEYDLTSLHVLAHDYGDTVAQELLARQNEGRGQGNWLSCCFLNGGLFPEPHRARLVQKLLLTPLGPFINRLIGEAQFKRSLSAVFGPQTKPSEDELDAFWHMLTYNDGKSVLSRLLRYMPERKKFRERWRGALTEAKIPLALINGSLDPVSGAHMVDYYLEHVGTPSYLKRIEDVGHYPQTESPQKVIESYREFLTGK